MTQNIIVELIKIGYDLEDIKKFIRNIFDNYTIQNDILSTNYPHSVIYENYENEKGFDRLNLNQDIINEISALTKEERIKSISYYFYKKKERANYIFVVEGLKGKIDLEIGGVIFYSLDKRRFISPNENSYDHEDLQRYVFEEKEKFIQASIEIDYLLPKSSLNNAITKLEYALDLIGCYYNTKTIVEVNPSNYIIVKNGKFISSSWSRDKNEKFYKHINSLDLNKYRQQLNKLNKFDFIWIEKNTNNKAKSKLLNAIHWYNKAQKSAKQEDKMLNYWIAVENLFNLEFDIKNDIIPNPKKGKINLIQEIISSIQIFEFVYEYGWELFHHYENIVNNPFDKKEIFPKELVLKANLKSKDGENIYLKKFIESLPEIREFEKDLFIQQKIDSLINFYNNSTESKEIISKQINIIENDILMIYRFRNLIVHNAHFDNALLPYFVCKIKDYAGDLIRKLINEFNDKDKELSSLMIGIYLKREEFLCNLDLGKVNLFDK